MTDATQVVFKPTTVTRLLFVGGGCALAVLFAWLALTDEVLWLVAFACGCGMAIEGVQARVLVDVGEGRIISSRALRSTMVKMEDVAAVRVPRWGPVVLRLRDGSKTRSGIWPGQVVTGLYANRLDPDSLAVRLAEIIEVPLEADWGSG
jgi:hypothetical protein